MILGGDENQIVTAIGRRDVVTQNSKQVKGNMAAMVAISGIAGIMGIVGRQPRSGIMLRMDPVAIVRPRRADSENGQHQPQREEAFQYAHGAFINRLIRLMVD